jgi:nucleoside-diphosphate-sugar epimerase
MKKVLITGACGFIGRQTLPLLQEKGYEVHGTVLPSQPPVDRQDIHWHIADLLNPNDTERIIETIQPSHLLHFAWYTHPSFYRTAEENLSWVSASIHLAKTFAKQNGTRALFAGTCFEYDTSFGLLSEETTPNHPGSLYGTCKNALRLIVNDFFTQRKISSAWGRVFYLFGPHEYPQRLVPTVINSLLQNKPALCTEGTQIRDFLYVKDVASAFVSLLDSDVQGTVNIASGNSISIRDLVMRIASLIGREDLIRLGAFPTPPGDPSEISAEVHRLYNEVGWRPAYSLEEGLQQTLSWWKTQTDRTSKDQ